MNVRNGFSTQIPTPRLDPLLVGKVMGLNAFSEGDWVLLRYWDNTPTKVKQVQHNFIYVGLEGGETFGDTLIHFYPEELGYPLDHRFWSRHQKRCYLQCHMDRTLLRRWERKPQVIEVKGSEWKMLILGILTSAIVLAVSGLWMHYQIFRGLSDGVGHALNP